MLKLVLDHPKTKIMFKNVVKKLPFLIMYIPGWYKNWEMCDKVMIENSGMLKFIPDYYKNWEMWVVL